MTVFKTFLTKLDSEHPERAAWIKATYREAVDIMRKTRDRPGPRPPETERLD